MSKKNKIIGAIIWLAISNMIAGIMLYSFFPTKEYKEYTAYETELKEYNSAVREYQNKNYAEITRYYNEAALAGKILPKITLEKPDKYNLSGKYIEVLDLTLIFRNLYLSNLSLKSEKTLAQDSIEALNKTYFQFSMSFKNNNSDYYNCFQNSSCYFSGYLSSFNDKDHVLALLTNNNVNIGGLPPFPKGLIEPAAIEKPKDKIDVPAIFYYVVLGYNALFIIVSSSIIWIMPYLISIRNSKMEKYKDKDNSFRKEFSVSENVTYRKHICSNCGKS